MNGSSVERWPIQVSGASRTFVVADKEHRVYGYYAMAAGAVSHQLATGGVRRNMPDPVPVMVLARLAVDHRAQGIKLGGSLLQDAPSTAVSVAQNTGVRAFARARPARARQAVLRVLRVPGFPADPLVLMLVHESCQAVIPAPPLFRGVRHFLGKNE